MRFKKDEAKAERPKPKFQRGKRNGGVVAVAVVLMAALVSQATGQEGEKPRLRFSAGGSNEFTFDTGVLRGKLRASGKSVGLSSVVHIPSGTRLDRSMGLFSHYRVFTSKHRYGTAAWDWPSEAKLASDGRLEVRWPATADRPFELRAEYRWATPESLDVETSVEARTDLPKFESFLASYFAEEFTNSLVYVSESPNSAGTKGFMPAEQSHGMWQAFPRDDSAIDIVRDGRWKLEPNPVDWVIMPRLASPLGIRRSPTRGLTAVLMAPPQDCFALLTPHQAEPHNSFYLSLFGRDLKAGETARARARLAIGSKLSEEEIVRGYQTYLNTRSNP